MFNVLKVTIMPKNEKITRKLIFFAKALIAKKEMMG